MTKQHFQHAADIVRAILNGEWTSEPPSWYVSRVYGDDDYISDNNPPFDGYYDPLPNDEKHMNITRAVQTAEAYIKLFAEWNPRFDQQRFLVACGLVEKTAKGRKQ